MSDIIFSTKRREFQLQIKSEHILKRFKKVQMILKGSLQDFTVRVSRIGFYAIYFEKLKKNSRNN